MSQYLLLYEMSGGSNKEKFLTYEYDVARLTARTRSIDSKDVEVFLAAVRERADEIFGEDVGMIDYTGFMAGDPAMAGDYHGYEGPCPPWNDERLHHYQFILYAVDFESCPVSGRFTGQDVQQAIDGHVIAETKLTGIYSLNPEVR